jgi:hypothetical protein
VISISQGLFVTIVVENTVFFISLKQFTICFNLLALYHIIYTLAFRLHRQLKQIVNCFKEIKNTVFSTTIVTNKPCDIEITYYTAINNSLCIEIKFSEIWQFFSNIIFSCSIPNNRDDFFS